MSFFEIVAGADHLDLHARLMQVIEIVPDKALKQAHEVGDLLDRPVPVLHRKAVDRQIVKPKVDRRPHGFAQGFKTAPVALDPRQPSPRRPAPVAVHDDADMRRNAGQARSAASVVLFGSCPACDGLVMNGPPAMLRPPARPFSHRFSGSPSTALYKTTLLSCRLSFDRTRRRDTAAGRLYFSNREDAVPSRVLLSLARSQLACRRCL